MYKFIHSYDSRRRQSVNDLQVQNGLVHTRGKLYEQGKERPCVICQARGVRNPLQARDQNSSRKPASRRTTQGCIQCGVALCNDCCKERLQAANAREDTEDTDSEDTEK